MQDIEEFDPLEKLPNVEQSSEEEIKTETGITDVPPLSEEYERLSIGLSKKEYRDARREAKKELAKLPLLNFVPPTSFYRALRYAGMLKRKKSALEQSRK